MGVGAEGEKERKRDVDWLSPAGALTGDGTWNLRECPDRELNRQPSGVQEGRTPNQLNHAGQGCFPSLSANKF